MKFPYAVRRYLGRDNDFRAWTPFDSYVNGRGSTKEEAIASLKKQLQEALKKSGGELGEIEI